MLIKVVELECKRCRHKWVPRGRDVRICPSCKSVRWDTERVAKQAVQN